VGPEGEPLKSLPTCEAWTEAPLTFVSEVCCSFKSIEPDRGYRGRPRRLATRIALERPPSPWLVWEYPWG
jgi:hypothetical protein